MSKIKGTGRLTTHVLDTASGRPAADVRIQLYAQGADSDRSPIVDTATNADGRCDRPLLEGDAFKPGAYEIRFHVGDYFRTRSGGPSFYEIVPVPFIIEDAEAHYHVPLLIAPFAYSTYRGS